MKIVALALLTIFVALASVGCDKTEECLQGCERAQKASFDSCEGLQNDDEKYACHKKISEMHATCEADCRK